MFTAARIQVVQNPEGSPPEYETWQVWAVSQGAQEAIVEVTAPREYLPCSVLKQAARRIGYRITVGAKDITAEVIKKGPKNAPAPTAP